MYLAGSCHLNVKDKSINLMFFLTVSLLKCLVMVQTLSGASFQPCDPFGAQIFKQPKIKLCMLAQICAAFPDYFLTRTPRESGPHETRLWTEIKHETTCSFIMSGSGRRRSLGPGSWQCASLTQSWSGPGWQRSAHTDVHVFTTHDWQNHNTAGFVPHAWKVSIL